LFYRLSHFIFKITEALRRYGVSDTGTALFVVRIAPTKEENVQDKMNATIKGYIVPVNTLQQLTDWSAIRKVYQIA
jgi:EKC/KEOPS complex subunit CGI121/TPRKB